jgi:pimeloyl-ACP methyl ester carboxylesterase
MIPARLIVAMIFGLVTILSMKPAPALATACARPALPPGFSFGRAKVNGATLNYIIGGQGPPLILIHGFPEDSSAWLGVMDALRSHFTFVTPDMRGIGRSIAPSKAAFDALTLAEDVKSLSDKLGLVKPLVAGHDMGGIVAYTLGRAHPLDVRGVMLIENPLPGVEPWDRIAADAKTWHIHFQQSPDTPELLISGREAEYFRKQFFEGGVGHPSTVSEASLRRYACAYTGIARLKAGLGQYRAVREDANFESSHASPTSLRLMLVGGENAFGPSMPIMAQDLRQRGWANVTVDQIPGASHYLLDEHPEAIARLLLHALDPASDGPR